MLSVNTYDPMGLITVLRRLWVDPSPAVGHLTGAAGFQKATGSSMGLRDQGLIGEKATDSSGAVLGSASGTQKATVHWVGLGVIAIAGHSLENRVNTPSVTYKRRRTGIRRMCKTLKKLFTCCYRPETDESNSRRTVKANKSLKTPNVRQLADNKPIFNGIKQKVKNIYPKVIAEDKQTIDVKTTLDRCWSALTAQDRNYTGLCVYQWSGEALMPLVPLWEEVVLSHRDRRLRENIVVPHSPQHIESLMTERHDRSLDVFELMRRSTDQMEVNRLERLYDRLNDMREGVKAMTCRLRRMLFVHQLITRVIKPLEEIVEAFENKTEVNYTHCLYIIRKRGATIDEKTIRYINRKIEDFAVIAYQWSRTFNEVQAFEEVTGLRIPYGCEILNGDYALYFKKLEQQMSREIGDEFQTQRSLPSVQTCRATAVSSETKRSIPSAQRGRATAVSSATSTSSVERGQRGRAGAIRPSADGSAVLLLGGRECEQWVSQRLTRIPFIRILVNPLTLSSEEQINQSLGVMRQKCLTFFGTSLLHISLQSIRDLY